MKQEAVVPHSQYADLEGVTEEAFIQDLDASYEEGSMVELASLHALHLD